MSISSDEEKKTVNTEKLMQSAINSQLLQNVQTDKIYSSLQQPQFLQSLDNILSSHFTQKRSQANSYTQFGLQSLDNISSSHFTQKRFQANSYTQFGPFKNTQNTQIRTDSTISFCNYTLQKCYEMNKKFRPITGMELTEKQ